MKETKKIAIPSSFKLSAKQQDVMSMYIIFAVIVVINAILDRNFLTLKRISRLLIQATPLVMAAMSQTMSLITGGINLSVGVVIAMMSCIAAVTMPLGLGVSIVIVIAAGLLSGCINGLLVTYGRLPAMIVTLAMQFFWHGVTLLILPKAGGSVDKAFFTWFNGGVKTWSGLIVILCALLVWKYIKTTRLGVSLYAVGNNEKAAYANGINTRRVRICAYIIGGFFAALAGISLIGITGSGDPNVGATYTMNSIAASIIGGASFAGGKGQMRGVVLGAAFVTLLMNVLFFSGLSSFYQYLLQGAILIASVSFKTLENRRKEETAHA